MKRSRTCDRSEEQVKQKNKKQKQEKTKTTVTANHISNSSKEDNAKVWFRNGINNHDVLDNDHDKLS